jgi:FMN phosphatase YigB (HAD superfamily)
VEDSLANLWPAWEMGWSTVWVSREAQQPFCVEHMIRSLHELPYVVPQPIPAPPLQQWVYA